MKEFLLVVGALAFVIALVLLNVFVVMWAWNIALPTILGATTITFWEALGLYVLVLTFSMLVLPRRTKK